MEEEGDRNEPAWLQHGAVSLCFALIWREHRISRFVRAEREKVSIATHYYGPVHLFILSTSIGGAVFGGGADGENRRGTPAD